MGAHFSLKMNQKSRQVNVVAIQYGRFKFYGADKVHLEFITGEYINCGNKKKLFLMENVDHNS